MRPRYLVFAMIGFIAASVFTASSIGQERTAPDAKPYLAVAYAQSAKQVLVLQRMQGTCPDGLRRAIMMGRNAPLAWMGCWREREGKVEIWFEDGDLITLDRNDLTWLPETGA